MFLYEILTLKIEKPFSGFQLLKIITFEEGRVS